MSGEAGGLLTIPMVASRNPMLGLALAGVALAVEINAANNASSRYERNMRRNRNVVRRSEPRGNETTRNEITRNETKRNSVNSSLEQVRQKMSSDMENETKANIEVSDNMMKEMENSRRNLQNLIDENNPEKFQNYIDEIKNTRTEMSTKLFTMQEEFTKNYQAKINVSMDNVTSMVNSDYDKCIKELQQFQNNQLERNNKAKGIADDYIEEAKSLLEDFEIDFEAKKFSKLQLMDLQRTLNEAIRLYNSENYEAAIATAKNVTLETLEEIYKADCQKQEWDNYYKLALTIASELEAFITAQEVISPEVKKQVELRSGKPVEDEIVGLKVNEYTGKMEDGRYQLDYYLDKTREIKTLLESDQSNMLTTKQLKEYVELLNGNLYPLVQQSIYKGILNMNNAFSRQNISEEIIDFFEDHNFTFSGYNYDNDSHDGALHVGFENDATGEEIIVTLAPEYQNNGEVQTKVEINQLKGDETNEERKAYYRTSVENVVLDNTPGAQIKLECNKATRNRLSDKTTLRDKLKM